MNDEKIKALRDAYNAAADAQRDAYYKAAAYSAAAATYRVVADATYRAADDAWKAYQAALKAEKGGAESGCCLPCSQRGPGKP